MPLDVTTTIPAPHRPTQSLTTAAQPVRHDRSAPPRWVERLRRDPLYSTITLVVDIFYATFAVALAQWWWTPDAPGAGDIALYGWLFVPIVIVLLAARSMYRRKLSPRFLDDFEPVQTSIAVATLATLAITLLFVPAVATGEGHVRPGDLVLRIWVCAVILIPGVRLIRAIANRHLRRTFDVGAPVLIIGSGPVTHQLIERMRQVPEYGLHPAGVLDGIAPADMEVLGVPYLGTADDLESAARATGAEKLIVAPSSTSDEQLARTAQQAQNLGMRVRVVPRLMDAVGVGAWVEHLGGIPLMVLCHIDPKGWQFAVKHSVDRTAAALGLLVISPLFLGLILLVKLSSPGPILFRQERIGRDGKVFDCLKFRSMRPADPIKAGFDLKTGAAPGGVEGDDRRTRIGKIMRKTSLDELPQLLNVLRGDMSLVGPRPERPEFVDLFAIQVRRYGDRHRVKAGITGWSQVHGLRGQTSIADRAEFDNYYIENWSLNLDFRILALTVSAVLRGAE